MHRVVIVIHPILFPDGLCSICNPHLDSIMHMFFTCPQSSVFGTILFLKKTLCLTDSTSIAVSVRFLQFTSIRSNSQLKDASSNSIAIIALAEIWWFHWKYVFDNQSFYYATILHRTIHLITKCMVEKSIIASF